MIKIIASDLDGTLLTHGADKLNPEIFDIVLSLKKHGIHFISASGRPLDSQKALWKPIIDEISYIGENGALCIYDHELFVISSLETELAHRIIREVERDSNRHLLISCPQNCYVQAGNIEFLRYIHDFLKLDVIQLDDLTTIPEPIVKISYNDANNWKPSSETMRQTFQGKADVVTSGNCWVDLMPLNCNKGAGLAFMLNKFGIAPEDAIAFGDQPNDIEMLSLVGNSYAMSTGAAETQKHAKYITDSVEKTLFEILKKLENDH